MNEADQNLMGYAVKAVEGDIPTAIARKRAIWARTPPPVAPDGPALKLSQVTMI